MLDLDLSYVDPARLDSRVTLIDDDSNRVLHQHFDCRDTVAFDIETGPLPADELAKIMDPFPAIEPFDEANVKIGNLKDEQKIAQKIADAREKHVADHERRRNEYEQQFVEKAPLDPMRGQVLAIGYGDHDGQRVVHAADEADMMVAFWELVRHVAQNGGRLVGWNTHKFDLPFIRTRSFRHEVEVPEGVLTRGGRYWHDSLVDLMTEWVCGQGYQSLDRVSQFLQVGIKTEDGAYFHQLWEEARDRAIAYLANDIDMTVAVARRMGY